MRNIAEQSKEHSLNTKDPHLYEEIMCIASDSPHKDFDLQECKDLLRARGFYITHECLVYKAVQILVKSKLLERDYSVKRERMVYRLALTTSASMI